MDNTAKDTEHRLFTENKPLSYPTSRRPRMMQTTNYCANETWLLWHSTQSDPFDSQLITPDQLGRNRRTRKGTMDCHLDLEWLGTSPSEILTASDVPLSQLVVSAPRGLI